MPTAQQVADRYRRRILSREQQATERLIGSWRRIYERLDRDVARFELEIERMDDPPPAWRVTRLESYRRLRESARQETQRYASIVLDQSERLAEEAFGDGTDYARQITEASIPAEIRGQVMALWQNVDPGAVRTATGYFQPGSPLVTTLDQYGDDAAQLMETKLLEAIGAGLNPRGWGQAIAAALGQPAAWGINQARTAQLQAYRQSTLASYRRNNNVVRGWTWGATRGPRTCMSCIAMDGTEHTLDETLDDHHQGRCTMLPLLVSWRELGIDLDDEPTGYASAKDWFMQQDEATQRKMFGSNPLYDAWKKSNIGWSDLSVPYEDAVWGRMLGQASYADVERSRES